MIFFVVIESIVRIFLHIRFCYWCDFCDIKQLFTCFNFLDIRLTFWTGLAAFSFKNKVLVLTTIETWISVTRIWGDIWTLFGYKERLLSKFIFLSNIAVNIFITRQDVFRTNFLEIDQIFYFWTLFFSYIKVRSWLITLCTTCCCSERLGGIAKNIRMWLFKSILLNFIIC